MKFTTESIGGKLIESITAGLYDGNLNCLREYVQNSIDSGAQNIEIYFENGNKDLIIKDDGSGMSKEELKNALSIGISNKTEGDAGWRGIGIWSGVPACKRIVIITKKNNDKKFRIEIDNDLLRNEYLSNKPVLDILANATGEIEEKPLGKNDSLEKDSFTEVRLESILITQTNIFRENEIQKYLSRNVPAPLDENSFSFATDINEWLKEENVRVPGVHIKFKGDKIFRPPFKSDIFFKDVIKKEFKINDELIAVGWFLTNKENKKLKEPNSGIYLKKNGFTIGNENTVRNLYSSTYNPWQYGEIHIISKELRENSSRNSLELNSKIVYPFLEDVGKFIGQLQMLNRYQSSKVSSNTINKAQGFLDAGDLKSAKKQLDKVSDSSKVSFPAEPSVHGMKPLIDTLSEQNKKDKIKLETEIKQMKPDIINKKKEQLETIIDNLPVSVKNSIRRATIKGQLYPEMSITDSLRDILKEKTGLNANEIFELSMEAYGWKDVIPGKEPILTIDPMLSSATGKEINKRAARNRRFGVVVYTIHDLFVNLCKHEKDKDSFEWFEGTTDEEKYQLLVGMYAIVGLIYRLIEKSDKYQPSN